MTKGRQIERVTGNWGDGFSVVIFVKPNCNYNLLLSDGYRGIIDPIFKMWLHR